MGKSIRSAALLMFVCLLFAPSAALAQSSIAGLVRDSSGALLPGVTVEASSPALIEKVRIALTDGAGQYKIVDLRPGEYTVTFSLPGFSTVRREGIELSASFTATVNADMRVGALEETITVSGASPVVDTQGVVQQKTMTASLIEALPTARSLQQLSVTIPGIIVTAGNRPSGQDVGGLAGERNTLRVHGGRTGDMRLLFDGLDYGLGNSSGATTGYVPNPSEVQEFSYGLGAISADTATGGIRINLIPKDGGNAFAGSFFGDFTNGALQSNNFSDELKARGLTDINKLVSAWDVSPTFGGPIRKDKLWFFGAFRAWTMREQTAGMYYNLTPTSHVFTPDLTRPAIDDAWNTWENVRLTLQANQKDKVSLYVGDGHRCQCHWGVNATRAPDASGIQRNPTLFLAQSSWTRPVTNRLLLEAGVLTHHHRYTREPQPDAPWSHTLPAITELSTGLRFRATDWATTLQIQNSYRAAASYVTGSHAIKIGTTYDFGSKDGYMWANDDTSLNLLNGQPRSVTVYATPYTQLSEYHTVGVYAEDRWTLHRMTLNMGLRFDQHRGSDPAIKMAPVRYVGERDFAEIDNVPLWRDLSPRLGVAYDLFGNSKTALKATISRYVLSERIAFAEANNQVVTTVNSTTRTWQDSNGDWYPQENELGPLQNPSFGQVVVRTRYPDEIREGFKVRPYNWEVTAGVQHELIPRVSVETTYFRRWYGNFTVTDNLNLTPADHDPYCVTAPVDARLPGGGGNQICGFYDLTGPAFARQQNNLVSFASDFGKQLEVYDGVDVTMSARLPNSFTAGGGLNTGRTKTNNCFVVDSPQQLYQCEVSPPFQPFLKLFGVAPLPWGIQMSAIFQTSPGPQISATNTFTSAQIRDSLGRNLSSGAQGSVALNLIQPGTLFGERTYQVDWRFNKTFGLGGARRLQAHVDLYNLLNASTVLTLNNTYGPNWLQPTYVLPGRMLKFGVQMNF